MRRRTGGFGQLLGLELLVVLTVVALVVSLVYGIWLLARWLLFQQA